MTEKKIKVGSVCSYSLPVVIKREDCPIRERNTSLHDSQLTGFSRGREWGRKKIDRSKASVMLARHALLFKSHSRPEKGKVSEICTYNALSPAVVTVLVLVSR